MVFHLRPSARIYAHFSEQPLWLDRRSGGNSGGLRGCRCRTSSGSQRLMLSLKTPTIHPFLSLWFLFELVRVLESVPAVTGEEEVAVHHRTHTVVNGVCLGLKYLN